MGENRFDVARIGALGHRRIQLHHAAEFVAVTILRVGQDELRVVLCGHGFNLPSEAAADCEPEHKFRPDDRQ